MQEANRNGSRNGSRNLNEFNVKVHSGYTAKLAMLLNVYGEGIFRQTRVLGSERYCFFLCLLTV